MRGGDGAPAVFDHTDANEVPGFAVLTPQDPLRGLDDLAARSLGAASGGWPATW